MYFWLKVFCVIQIFRKMMKYSKKKFLEILEKKALKMTSQLVIFRAYFSRPPDPKSEMFFFSINQIIKNSGLNKLYHHNSVNDSFIPPANFVCGGVNCFHVVCACVRACVRLCVCPSILNVFFFLIT